MLEYERPSEAQRRAADDAAVRELGSGRLGELTEQFNDAKAGKRWEEAARLVEEMAAIGPRYPKNWSYLQWQLGVEVSGAAEGRVFRYDFARRSVDMMLTGLQRMDRHPEVFFQLGQFFRSRFRDETDGEMLLEAFRSDHDFQQRLDRVIDLDATLGPDGAPHPALVASQFYRLMEHDLDTRGVPRDWDLPVHVVLLYSFAWREQMTFAAHIQRLDVARENCRQAWREAEDALNAYAEREFLVEPGLQFRMSDVEIDGQGQPRLLRRPEGEGEKQLTDDQQATWIIRYQNMANFQYWRQRVQVEQTDELLNAWEQLRTAHAFVQRTRNEDLDLNARDVALREVRTAIAAWDAILDRHTYYAEEESLTRYLGVLREIAGNVDDGTTPGEN